MGFLSWPYKADHEIAPEDRVSQDFRSCRLMNIEGPMKEVNYRMKGMTPAERQYRAKYLKHVQVELDLTPVESEAVYKIKYNPLRRFCNYPMRKMELFLQSKQYPSHTCTMVPWMLSRTVFVVAFLYYAHYTGKYGCNDWTRVSGWKYTVQPNPSYHDDIDFPRPVHFYAPYYDNGFKDSPI